MTFRQKRIFCGYSWHSSSYARKLKRDSFKSLVIRFCIWSRLFIFHAIKNLHTPLFSFCHKWKSRHGGVQSSFSSLRDSFSPLLDSHLTERENYLWNKEKNYFRNVLTESFTAEYMYTTGFSSVTLALRPRPMKNDSKKKKKKLSVDKLVPCFFFSLTQWGIKLTVIDLWTKQLERALGYSL